MLTFTERRRLALVAVISLIALPAILLMGNDTPKNDSTTQTMTTASPTKIPDNSEPADPAFLPIPSESNQTSNTSPVFAVLAIPNPKALLMR